MVQRIQSIYLILTTLLAILFLSGNIIIYTEGAGRLSLNLYGINRILEGGNNEIIVRLVPLSIALLIVPVLSFLAIFLFKNRKVQMRMVALLIIFILIESGVVIYYSLYATQTFSAEIVAWYKMTFPFLMLVFSFLAYRGISKDEELVRSYDRLR